MVLQRNILLLGSILLVALTLRIIGITWGLPEQDTGNLPFHPDENISVLWTSQIDVLKGDLNPEAAHNEGTISVYLWSANALLLRALGIIQKLPHELGGYNEHYRDFLLASRLLVVFFDLISLCLVFCIIKRLTQQGFAPYLGALIFAILPYEAIHANYMRSHVITNTFMLLTFLYSLKLWEQDDWKACAKVRILAGLTMATRYPLGLVVMVSANTVIRCPIFCCQRQDLFALCD